MFRFRFYKGSRSTAFWTAIFAGAMLNTAVSKFQDDGIGAAIFYAALGVVFCCFSHLALGRLRQGQDEL